MSSEFESGYSVLPPIGEGVMVKGNLTTDSHSGDKTANDVKPNNINNNINGFIMTESDLKSDLKKQERNDRIRDHHKRNRVKEEQIKEIYKTRDNLPASPFHSILEQRPASRRTKLPDDRYDMSLVARKPVFRVSDQARFKPVSSATESS